MMVGLAVVVMVVVAIGVVEVVDVLVDVAASGSGQGTVSDTVNLQSQKNKHFVDEQIILLFMKILRWWN